MGASMLAGSVAFLAFLVLVVFAAALGKRLVGNGASGSRTNLSPAKFALPADFAGAPDVVFLWPTAKPLVNPACDFRELWSHNVPIEVDDVRDLFGHVLLAPAPSLTEVSKHLPPRVRVLLYSSQFHSASFALAVEALVRPRVSVFMSDERGLRRDHAQLRAPVVLRQYASASDEHWPAHVRQIPILTHCWDALLPHFDESARRDLPWCFVGSAKGQRAALCSAMAAAFPGGEYGPRPQGTPKHLYARSLLCLNPRGDNVLETSRAYAAMRLGCVPVGCAPQEEVEESYSRLEPRCPLLDLYAPTVAGMLALARDLISDAERWGRASADCRAWDAACRARIRRLAENPAESIDAAIVEYPQNG